jgi:tripartite-type tricarboxylate transporter receptor subunit TctC
MLEVPEVSNKLKDMGLELRGSTPEEFSTFLDSEYKRWGDTIKAAGISVAE